MNAIEAKVSVQRVFNTFHSSPSRPQLSDNDVDAIVSVVIGDTSISDVPNELLAKVDFYNTTIKNFKQIVEILAPTNKEHLIGVLHDRFLNGMKMSECAKKNMVSKIQILHV